MLDPPLGPLSESGAISWWPNLIHRWRDCLMDYYTFSTLSLSVSLVVSTQRHAHADTHKHPEMLSEKRSVIDWLISGLCVTNIKLSSDGVVCTTEMDGWDPLPPSIHVSATLTTVKTEPPQPTDLKSVTAHTTHSVTLSLTSLVASLSMNVSSGKTTEERLQLFPGVAVNPATSVRVFMPVCLDHRHVRVVKESTEP